MTDLSSPSRLALPRPVRAPRGTALSCRSWLTEAAYRMLQNNLDPEVAENPDALVVYGGIGKAARDWPSFEAILAEFEGSKRIDAVKAVAAIPHGGTGDVKYHYGASGTYATGTGRGVTVTLSPNPSHLEYVNPVIEGRARADQTSRKARELTHDTNAVVPVLIHGDAAFPGQGIVAETLNLQALPGCLKLLVRADNVQASYRAVHPILIW